MSSRLVKGGLESARPMVWQPKGRPIVEPPEIFPRVPEPKPPVADPGSAQVAELEGRIRMLERESEHRAQAAFQQGAQQGEANARQQAAAQLESKLEQLARSINDISGQRQRCRREAEEDVVKLSLAIARRIVRRELTIDSGAILGLVKAALEKLDARELQTIRVHPETAGSLKQHLERMGLPQRIEVTADHTLERGAAILETARGAVDASAETQLAEIERGFTDLVRHAT